MYGGKRDLADRLDAGIHVPVVVAPEPHGAPPETKPREHLGVQHDAVPLEAHPLARPQFLSRMDERVPRAAAALAQQQALDGARRSARADRAGALGSRGCR